MVPNIANHPSCFPLSWDGPAKWLARGKDLKIWTSADISEYFQVWCSCGRHCDSYLANSVICNSLGAGPMLQLTSAFYAFLCNLTAIILPLQRLDRVHCARTSFGRTLGRILNDPCDKFSPVSWWCAGWTRISLFRYGGWWSFWHSRTLFPVYWGRCSSNVFSYAQTSSPLSHNPARFVNYPRIPSQFWMAGRLPAASWFVWDRYYLPI